MTLAQVFYFILGSLGTYYLSTSFVGSSGPFDLFDWLRGKFDSGTIGKGLRCYLCVSFWAAGFFAAALTGYLHGFQPPWPEMLFWWPGLAGMATLFEKYWKR